MWPEQRAKKGSAMIGNDFQPREVDLSRRRFMRIAALTISAAQFAGIASAKPHSVSSIFDGASAWLNSEPLTSTGLQGKVILVDFWTYSCINWRRQLPYVRAWAEKYRDHGLVVVGVHTPEFSFERNIENVRWATKDMRIEHPVVMDNDYAIWRAFNNEYWPALYFVDARGRVRHSVFGEGQYVQSEMLIQRLLTEAGAGSFRPDLISVTGQGAEASADLKNLNSGENYLGYQRTENFSSSGGAKPDRQHDYLVPKKLVLNRWALSGTWTMGREATALNQPNGRILYRFHARDLHLVMGPLKKNAPIRFRVFVDGQPPNSAHGVDVDEQGSGIVAEVRLYQLIRQQPPIMDRTFEIEFLDRDVAAFSFTFG